MQATLKIAVRIPPGTREEHIRKAIDTLTFSLSGEHPSAYVDEPVQYAERWKQMASDAVGFPPRTRVIEID